MNNNMNNNNDTYIFSVSQSMDDLDNPDIFNIINSMLIDLKNNSNIFNNSQNENIVQFNIEYEYETEEIDDSDEPNYFKNCNVSYLSSNCIQKGYRLIFLLPS